MSTLGEILEKLDITSYFDREGIEYKETHGTRGMQLNVKECPVCGGDKWKVFINADSGLGNCFSGSCEAKFNKYSYIKAHTSLSGKSLFEHIEAVGIEIGWRPPRKTSATFRSDLKDLVIPASIALPHKGRNMKYLENRGISTDVAAYFRLRICIKGWFKYLVGSEERYMPFHQRVIIPIYNEDGKLVSFQGRDITGKAEKKYLFPPGFAATGAYLFNAHNVVDTKRVVVGEGVFDVMAIKIALDADESLRDVVPIGSFGKHLSVDQLVKFQQFRERGVEEVTFMWDGELVATDDAIDAAIKLRSLGFRVRVALLPTNKDPNEVAPEVVRQAFYSAELLTATSAIALKMRRRM
jgi:DNA primase